MLCGECNRASGHQVADGPWQQLQQRLGHAADVAAVVPDTDARLAVFGRLRPAFLVARIVFHSWLRLDGSREDDLPCTAAALKRLSVTEVVDDRQGYHIGKK